MSRGEGVIPIRFDVGEVIPSEINRLRGCPTSGFSGKHHR